MRLDKITNKDPDCEELIMCGWKQFNGWGGELHFQNVGIDGKLDVPMDQWIKAESKKIGDWRSKYQSGFHIYSDEVEMESLPSARRVYYRGVETIGTQDGKTVIVARWMYVPTDPDAWPPLRK